MAPTKLWMHQAPTVLPASVADSRPSFVSHIFTRSHDQITSSAGRGTGWTLHWLLQKQRVQEGLRSTALVLMRRHVES